MKKIACILRSILAWMIIVAACLIVGALAGAFVMYLSGNGQAAASVAAFGTLLLCTLSGAFD
jgi:hypothetical protein